MSCYPTSIHFKRLLLTGAAGVLGRQLRPRLKAHCCLLRVSDIADLGSAAPGEELHPARLEDADAMSRLLEGVQAVVHLGGVSTEQPWEAILQANIIGAYNLYEAARKQAVPRVVFASSNHVTGFYRRDQVVGLDDPARPDGLYGLSKTFGEDLARLYFDRYGIETVCLRIGSALPEPHDRRTLATWISYDDLERLVVASLTAPMVGHSIIYGVGDNAVGWWDNHLARHIGYQPQDSSERFRSRIESSEPPPDMTDPATIYQGGIFVRSGPLAK
ncbi:NAD-dependent epimerase/dehydratase family protein [Verminephrobacter eiseniae]|uniref:NAD-dependent epimerase/dehydratase n=1 Tax=Verminephrobacter eiseniae (strain EF01-2) TaxID=391735 RepID=A1WHA0_VEREI|nr:NAD(P)-dependent oxidoreductase [Verminephrobacter eiseniae]ABM57007.1 NAD-dependent epimerase/dehydratase [Verminephrobacter eiseniae EF01-2]MCW5234060.1 NAD(P)-dependent oxidoreductase [Verminephrobacter eiseniae]MCW5262188.1 NAD(P)-dependent oxidoreductase [Verminephrobacter eiseniae]MCW5287346.1 NAD(P)-dependent oxidoreductase [Verminephrobacter eiseniae]MCW5294383.1 NAD(P)-dependent oxidoreductase [Verminephrobacter eiseniae]